MGSTISRSAKQQTWGPDERKRQLSFIRGAIQMLRNGKPRNAARFLQENGVTGLQVITLAEVWGRDDFEVNGADGELKVGSTIRIDGRTMNIVAMEKEYAVVEESR